MKIDLHLHSHVSDGDLSPAALVAAALSAGLNIIALTDHDTAAGVAAAKEARWVLQQLDRSDDQPANYVNRGELRAALAAVEAP